MQSSKKKKNLFKKKKGLAQENTLLTKKISKKESFSFFHDCFLGPITRLPQEPPEPAVQMLDIRRSSARYLPDIPDFTDGQ